MTSTPVPLPDIIRKMLMVMHFNPSQVSHAADDLYSLINSIAMRQLLEKLPVSDQQALNTALIDLDIEKQGAEILKLVRKAYSGSDIKKTVDVVAEKLLNRYAAFVVDRSNSEQHAAVTSLLQGIRS